MALDLKDDNNLIREYEEWHKPENSWVEIKKSIKESGVINMEIYRTGNRLFMIMEVDDSFTLEKKAQMDSENPKVKQWETLMSNYQQDIPWAKQGEKWVAMKKIFELS